MIDFKPSDVALGVPPLVGTMGRSEIEVAAAIVVRCLALTGDTWRAMTEVEFSSAFESDPYIACLCRNPFLNADFGGLRDKGYGVPPDCFGLTEKGIEALRKHVRKAVAQ